MADRMPPRDQVDPLFDGHLELPLREMTVEQRLAWIWTGMQLLALGRRARAERETPPCKTGTLRSRA